MDTRHVAEDGLSARRPQSAAGAVREVPVEVIHHVARVVFRSVDERRLAAPEDRQSYGIQPWRLDNSAIVPQVAFGIDDWHMKPAVIRA